MQITDRITDRISAIEARAAIIHLSLARVCSEAGVYPSTVSRWRDGTDPKMAKAADICGRLERVIEVHERRILSALSDRYAGGEQRLAS